MALSGKESACAEDTGSTRSRMTPHAAGATKPMCYNTEQACALESGSHTTTEACVP